MSKKEPVVKSQREQAFANTAETCALLERRIPAHLKSRGEAPTEPAGKAFWRVALLLAGHERRAPFKVSK